MEDDLFAAENKTKSNFWALDTVGETKTGVYVEKAIGPNRLNPGTLQTVYTLVQDDGTLIYVGGRTPVKTNGQENKILQGLEAAKLGEYVGLKYESQLEGKGGKQGAKIIGVYNKHLMKKDVLDLYLGVGAAAADDSPF